jgi:hypothetical protein
VSGKQSIHLHVSHAIQTVPLVESLTTRTILFRNADESPINGDAAQHVALVPPRGAIKWIRMIFAELSIKRSW